MEYVQFLANTIIILMKIQCGSNFPKFYIQNLFLSYDDV